MLKYQNPNNPMTKFQRFEPHPHNTSQWLDEILYPDMEIPDALALNSDRIDSLSRICVLWDSGLLPSNETISDIRKDDWTSAVDACQLLTSPAYHLVRQWHGLSQLPYLGQEIALIRDDPCMM